MKEDTYQIVTWPDVQELMHKEWFYEECILINNEPLLSMYGSSAYFVPCNRIKELDMLATIEQDSQRYENRKETKPNDDSFTRTEYETKLENQIAKMAYELEISGKNLHSLENKIKSLDILPQEAALIKRYRSLFKEMLSEPLSSSETDDDVKTDVMINIIEASSELAHRATIDEMVHKGDIDDEEEVWIGPEGDKHYTEKAQDIFNIHYDYFYEVISNAKVK